MGVVLAGAIAYCLVGDWADRFRHAFGWMLVACVVDGTDGWLARRARVKEVLPEFDGARLDDIIDFLNYTFLPLLLIFQARLLPGGQTGWLLVPLVASAYGFCQASAKTADGYFLGFPSYWNLAAFYFYILRPPGWLAVGLMLTLSCLTFVPSRYLYTTQPGRLNRVSHLLAAAWGVLLAVIVWGMPAEPLEDKRIRQLALWSLAYPAYYLVVSWAISGRCWLRRRKAA